MSNNNRIDGPDEDEHYEVHGHPNKAQKRTPQTTEPAEPSSSSNFRTRARSSSRSAGVLSTGRVSLSSSHIMLVGNSTPNMNNSISLHEQVSRAKDQAKEILAALDAEKLLDQDIAIYLGDVDASYTETEVKMTFPKLRAAWTREEDRLLTLGVRVYGPNTESWPRIAMLVPGRTNKSCRKRWFHSLDPSLHKGPWTPEEDSLLRERVSQFPAQWSRVAEGIQGRTDDQCAKRWRESLDPEIDRGKWRPEEDRLLLEKFAEFGTQWQKIATFFQGRPGLHCRNRWRKIQRIISQKERKTGPIPENDLNRTLAAVTESVNKRKTALRTRGPSSHPSRGTDSPPASSSSAVQFDAAQDASMEGLPGDQLASQQQEHQQQLDIQTSVSTAAGGMQSSQSGNTESIGAMYMPSEQQSAGTPATTPHFEGPLRGSTSAQFGQSNAVSGAKRSASVLFSPTEEQRQRLRKLGLRLYGCAAASNTCQAAFADAMSLNSHLKLKHPAVARLIPSLQGASENTISLLLAGGGSPIPDTPLRTQPKPYRCAQPGCNHQYKNVNGLEYHIFHSRKSNNHLMIPGSSSGGASGGGGASSGRSADGGSADGGSSGGTPDAAVVDYSPIGDPLSSVVQGSAEPMLISTVQPARLDSSQPGSMTMPAGGSSTNDISMLVATGGHLQCSEVECLASFGSKLELRQHMTAHHPRPIRRAVKPSNRIKGTPLTPGGSGGSSSSRSVDQAPGPGFWNQSILSDVFDSAGNSGIGPMPTIPEGDVSTTSTAALAAAIGYGEGSQRNSVYEPPTLPPHAKPHLVFSINPQQQPLNAFAPVGSPSFMSAPALISETGGEPGSIGSYFNLVLNNQQQQQQPQTPFLSTTGQLEMVTQQQHQQQAAPQNAGTPGANSTAASRLIQDMNASLDIQMMHNMLQQQQQQQQALFNHSNRSHGNLHLGGGGHTPGVISQDVSMEAVGGEDVADTQSPGYQQQHYPRSHRSDSIDLTSLATVPPGHSISMDTGAKQSVEDAAMHAAQNSFAAATAAMLSKPTQPSSLSPWLQDLSALGLLPLARDTTAGTSGGGVESQQVSSSEPQQQQHQHQQQQQRRIPQLALSAHAGDLQSRRDWQMLQQQQQQQQQQLYTPQPLDMAQFQQRQQQFAQQQQQQVFSQTPMGTSSAGSEYRRRFIPQFPLVTSTTAGIGSVVPPVADPLQPAGTRTGTSVVNCPVPLCGRGFSDANALKHHMSFDHPRDEVAAVAALRNSNPGSPSDQQAADLSTPPLFPSNRSSFVGMATMASGSGSAISQPQSAAQILTTPPNTGQQHQQQDRTKAPHWVDANMWSTWIAAANGHGDAETFAQATAMGITPGIGGPQTFLPQQQQQHQFNHHQQQHSENELLQMFDSVTSGDQMTLDQQLAMMESVLNTNTK